MPFDNLGFQEQARSFAAPHGTDHVLETLIKAREWLSDPAHWHQNPDVYENERGATCAWGATRRADSRFAARADYLLDAQADILGFPTAATYNDDPKTTHADVLALFDRAISARRSGA